MFRGQKPPRGDVYGPMLSLVSTDGGQKCEVSNRAFGRMSPLMNSPPISGQVENKQAVRAAGPGRSGGPAARWPAGTGRCRWQGCPSRHLHARRAPSSPQRAADVRLLRAGAPPTTRTPGLPGSQPRSHRAGSWPRSVWCSCFSRVPGSPRDPAIAVTSTRAKPALLREELPVTCILTLFSPFHST